MSAKDEVPERTRAVIDRLAELGTNPQLATPEEIKRADRYCELKQKLEDKGTLAMMTEYEIESVDMENKVAFVKIAIGTKDTGEFKYSESISACKFDEICEDCAELSELCKKCMELRCEQE